MAKTNPWLLAAAACNALAALIHVAAIAFGPAWYRFFGAGPQIAAMAARGHWYPATMALAIAAMLSVWAAYALSGAGAIRRLPLLRTALVVITAVYLLRGLLFMPMRAHFPGNSLTFWLWSSAICVAIGVLHLLGLRRAWPVLSRSRSGASS
jgi:hypothetical protein